MPRPAAPGPAAPEPGVWIGALQLGERAAAGWTLSVPRRSALGGQGSRLGQRAGTSLEFREHREYRPGDDLRHLDWSASARSDRLTVKLFHEEVHPHLDLVVDGSRSMALDGTAKGRATAAAAAFFAEAGRRGGFTGAAWLAAGTCDRLDRRPGPPSTWRGLDFRDPGHLAEALGRRPPRLHPRGLRVLLSDLLVPAPPREILGRLGREAVALVVVQILARVDAHPTPGGLVRLEDVETGRHADVLLDGAAVERYLAALHAHQDRWASACRETGAVLVTLEAEDLVASLASGSHAALGRTFADLLRLDVLGAAAS